MKYRFIFLLLIISRTAYSQQNTISDTIHWRQNYKLKWEDFQGVPDSLSPGGAGTVCGIYYQSTHEDDTSITLHVYSAFNKKRSWQKKQYQTPQSLNHEQGHFDISEVYARKLSRAFDEYKYNKVTATADIDSIFSHYFKEMNQVQTLYDMQTSNHRNFTKQKEWDKKIAAWLKKYSAK